MPYVKKAFSDFNKLYRNSFNPDILDCFLTVDDFDYFFRKDNTTHPGGFLVYVSSHLRPKRLLHLERLLPESFWIEIKDKSQTFFICTVYRSPNSAVEFWDRFNVCLENAIDRNNNIVILGDINEDQLNQHTFIYI